MPVIRVHDYVAYEKEGSNYAFLKHNHNCRDMKARGRAAALSIAERELAL